MLDSATTPGNTAPGEELRVTDRLTDCTGIAKGKIGYSGKKVVRGLIKCSNAGVMCYDAL